MKTKGIIKVPATSANVGPGFDCLGIALGLYNELEYELKGNPGDIEIDLEGEGKNLLSKGKDNLVYYSFKKVFEKKGKEAPGIKIKQINRIPLSRGLGSSSAAIVSGIVLASQLLEKPLSEKEMLNIATEIEGHPDNVAPALLGGFVVSFKENDDIISKKIKVPEEVSCTVIVPDFHLSTKDSRGVLPEKVTMGHAVFKISRAALLVSSLITEDYDLMRYAFADKLHQNYRAPLIPGLIEVIDEAEKMDILGTTLSGAGPSIIIYHKNDSQFDLDGLGRILENKGVFFEIYKLKPLQNGVLVKN
jgi:homoserine kinase